MAEIQFVVFADRSYYETYYDHVHDYAPNIVYPQEEFQKDFGSGDHTYKWLLVEEINSTEPKFVCAKRVYTEAQMKVLEPYCICVGCIRPNSWWSWLVGGDRRAYEGCLKRGWHGANPEYMRVAESKLGMK
jgi:hypothetical protein